MGKFARLEHCQYITHLHQGCHPFSIIMLPIEERTYDGALRVVVYAGILYLINSLSSSLSNYSREKQSHQVNDYIQSLIHDKTTRIQYAFFENPDYQDIYYRAINDANFRPTRIFYGLIGVVQNLVTIALLGSLLLGLDWLMSLLLLVAILPTAIQRMWFARKLFRMQRDQTEDERRVAYYNRLLTLKDYAKELRVFNLGTIFQTRYISLRDALRKAQMALLKKKTIGEIFTQLITAMVIVVFYGVIAVKTIKGEISGGGMVMYFLALQRGSGYFQELLSKLTSLYEDSLFVRNFVDFIDIEISNQPSVDRNVMFPAKIEKGIEFKNVGFKYEHSRNWVLKDFNMKIHPGETLALVGVNGAGKSTLIKLLAGLYESIEGSIEIDGIDIKNIHRHSIADNVSVIFQDFMLYNVSAKENIWFGNVMDVADDKEIDKAASDAGVHELISGLPNGFDTTLGNLFKESEQLSQGEWQRVALARSFYNKAQIIILDEPTSSLDAFNEAKIIAHFKEITLGKTSIIISHRLSTIFLADRIAVLKDAHLVEIGTYEELIENKGAFYAMTQALKNSFA
jgi:ATP-binding cassette subfamily B protein